MIFFPNFKIFLYTNFVVLFCFCSFTDDKLFPLLAEMVENLALGSDHLETSINGSIEIWFPLSKRQQRIWFSSLCLSICLFKSYPLEDNSYLIAGPVSFSMFILDPWLKR